MESNWEQQKNRTWHSNVYNKWKIWRFKSVIWFEHFTIFNNRNSKNVPAKYWTLTDVRRRMDNSGMTSLLGSDEWYPNNKQVKIWSVESSMSCILQRRSQPERY